MSHIMNSKVNKNKSRTPIVVDDDYCVKYGKVKNNPKYFTGATIVNGISIVKINIQKEENSSTVKIEKQEEKNNNIVIR